MAAVDAKVSLPAINNAVKVCCFAHDPRKVFAETANARTFTRLANYYQGGKIQSVGHTPVPDPGSEPRKDRSMVRALLPTPLTRLSLSRSGNLIIPDQEHVASSCPVTLSDKSLKKLQEWREQFATFDDPQGGAPQPPPQPQPAAGGGQGAGADGNPSAIGDESSAASGAKTTDFSNYEVLKSFSLPNSCPSSLKDIRVVLAKN